MIIFQEYTRIVITHRVQRPVCVRSCVFMNDQVDQSCNILVTHLEVCVALESVNVVHHTLRIICRTVSVMFLTHCPVCLAITLYVYVFHVL